MTVEYKTPEPSELMRLKLLYEKTYQKYEKRIDKLIEKRDYELDCIHDSILKLET